MSNKLIIICIFITIAGIAIGIILWFSFIAFMLGGGFGDMKSKEKIFSYVNKNYELLEQFPYTEYCEIGKFPYTDYNELLSNNQKREDFIKEYLGKKTIVQSVYAYNENILQYYCGGKGNATGSTYTGFYFSADDTPYALECNGHELREKEPGIFEWKSGDGNHRIYTEKIRDNWYYYIMELY